MNAAETFVHHLKIYSRTTGVALTLDDEKQNARRIKLLQQHGYQITSRGGAFFIIACNYLGSQPAMEGTPEKDIIAFGKAIAEVFMDNKHGRATSLDTAINSAIFSKRVNNPPKQPIAVKLGVELIEQDMRNTHKRVLTDTLANRILEKRDLY